MTDERDVQGNAARSGGVGWGISASILLHAVFAFALFFHMPVDPSEAQKEESVNVEIVPPPEEPQEKVEEQAKLAEPKAEAPPVEEAKKEEPPPPTEQPKQEEAKTEEPPPPPAELPKEEAKQPPPAAEEQAKQKPPPGNEQGQQQPLPVLRPVFQFGEKDAGPRQSTAGNSAEEATSPTGDTEPEVTEPAPLASAEDKPEVEAEAPNASPVPDEINLPEIDIASANPFLSGPLSGAAPDATRMEIVTPPKATTEIPAAKAPAIDKPSELKEAKTLFSRNSTNDWLATISMQGLSHGERASELCGTELKQQLRAMSYNPDIAPKMRFPEGATLMQTPYHGFRSNGQWYDVSFRCQIDENATKVLSFALDVGAPVPRGEWRKRGFPEY